MLHVLKRSDIVAETCHHIIISSEQLKEKKRQEYMRHNNYAIRINILFLKPYD